MTKTIDLKRDRNKNYKNLHKAVAKLFKNYPPQPRKQRPRTSQRAALARAKCLLSSPDLECLRHPPISSARILVLEPTLPRDARRAMPV